jgi:predicted esterase
VNQKVAALMIHGTADDTLPISGGQAARDYQLTTNHCTMTTMPSEPSPCVTYDGCDEGYPVVWCEHPGGHTVPSFSPTAVAPFFMQF